MLKKLILFQSQISLILFFSLISFANRPSTKIKGGSFTPLYGSNKEPVDVDDFYMDENPVTNKEFLTFTNSHPEWNKKKAKSLFVDSTYLKHWKNESELSEFSLEQSPVVYVSWFAANAFCKNEGQRLPTVNEWEYVASREIPGKDIKTLILEWYSIPTPEIIPSIKTGFKNSLGISNMHGLIWEWTLDYNSTMVTGESRADGSLDKTLYCGSGSLGASDKLDYAAFMRFGFRTSLKSNYTIGNLGFRCVKDIIK